LNNAVRAVEIGGDGNRLTLSDRLICGFCGAFLGLLLWSFAYVILVAGALKASARQPPNVQAPIDPMDRLPSFWWGWTFMTAFSLFGTAVGPEVMMDGFGRAWKIEAEFGREMGRS
jgi:hypothetical protein